PGHGRAGRRPDGSRQRDLLRDRDDPGRRRRAAGLPGPVPRRLAAVLRSRPRGRPRADHLDHRVRATRRRRLRAGGADLRRVRLGGPLGAAVRPDTPGPGSAAACRLTGVRRVWPVNDMLVWVDCEMTGLDLSADALIEVAAL